MFTFWVILCMLSDSGNDYTSVMSYIMITLVFQNGVSYHFMIIYMKNKVSYVRQNNIHLL